MATEKRPPRTPSFEEVLLGGGVYDGQACEEYAVHDVDAEATWALVMLACQHVALMCSACKRDVELRGLAGNSPDGSYAFLHGQPCGVQNYTWRWERL